MLRKPFLALSLLAAALLGGGVASSAGTDGQQFLMTRHVRDAALGARAVGRLAPEKVLRFDIVLPPGNPGALESFLADLYNPASAAYHHFLTPAEFTARFGPAQRDWDSLLQFAARNGFKVIGGSRDELDLRLAAPVAAVEKAFHVAMRVYQHPTEPRTYFSPDREPTVDIEAELWHVSGLDDFVLPRPRIQAAPATTSSGSCPGGAFCGSDMRAAYYGSGALTGSGQSIGLVEFHGYDAGDLANYFSSTGQTNAVPVNAISVDGTSVQCTFASGCDDIEQTVDMTQALGMAPGLAQLNVYVGSSDSAILSAMSVVPPNSVTGKVDAQLSCSWGWGPADPATDDPIFLKFAAQGQSFFAAAGDAGAYTASSQFVYPADDANVTVVGGTLLATQGAGGGWASESAWSSGGGGYVTADNIDIPAWQSAAVAAYNARSATPASTTLRNSPDVAAAANAAFYVCADQKPCGQSSVGGSSFAAPVWAGFLALANQQATAAGQGTVGFLNPTLYALGNAGGAGYAAAFHDVTSGGNGYFATTGFDLATGWGSPNGSGLITALVAAAVPTFTLTAGGTATISQGGTGTLSLSTAATGGFAAAIVLTVSGQPAGVTVTLSPTSVAAGAGSTATFQVATSVAPGSYLVTFTGTAGATTHSATATLTVTAAGFTLSASGPLSVPQGQVGTATVTIAVTGGYSAPIGLGVAGLPVGASASLGSSSISGAGSTSLTLTVGATAAPGSYSVIVTAISGSLQQSVVVPLTITVPTFTIAASGAVSIPQGNSGTVAVSSTVAGGFAGTIQLSAYGQPSGVTLSFGSSTLSGAGSTVLTASVAPTVPAGVYALTVAGASGTLTSTAAVTLTVTAASFTLSSSGAFGVGQGDTGSATITSTISGGFAAPVALSASGAPSGATVTFAPATLTGTGTAVMTVSVPAATPAGTYSIVVTGSSGFLTRTVTVPLTVLVPGFTVTASASVAVSQGSSGSAVVQTTAVDGFGGSVVLSATGLPLGMTASFSPASLTGGGTSQLTLQASANTPVGAYPITVTGTSGALVVSTSLRLTVVAAGFYLTAPSRVSVPEAQSVAVTLTSTAVGGFTNAVALSASTAINGITVSFSPATIAAGSGTSVATIQVATTTPSGSYPVTLIGTSGGVVETATLTLDVSSSTFTLSSPSAVSVAQGGSASTSVTSTSTGGFVGPVALSATGLPSGVTLTFSPATLSGTASSTLTFTAADGVAGGSYPLVVSGTSGGLTRTTNLVLTVTGPAFRMAASGSMSVAQGGTTTATITTTITGAFANAIALTASGQPPGVSVSFSPASITGAGSSLLTATVGSTVPIGVYSIKVTGTSGALTQWVSLTLTVTSAGFTLVAPGTASIAAGGSGTLTVTEVVSGGFSGTAVLGASGQPAGVSISFSPATLTGGGYSTMTLRVGTGVASGTYPITLSATSGTVTRTTTATLIVLPKGFSLAASGPLTLAEGATGSATVTSTVVSGFSGAIALSASGQPAGLLVTFNPAAIQGAGAATVSFAVGASVPVGTYPIKIVGTSGALSATTSIAVTVTAATFSLSGTSTLTVPEGTSGATTLTTTVTGGFAGQIALSGTGLPTGATLTFSPAVLTGAGSSTATVTVGASVPQGTYHLTITAASGGVSRTLTLAVVVVAPGFSLTVSGPVTATQGGSGTARITAVASGGFSGTIKLAATGQPAGVTATLSPAQVTGAGTSTLTLAAASTAKVGTYTVTVTGTSGTLTRSVPVTLTVN